MINFEELYKVFGETLPIHPSEFYSTEGNQVLPWELKMYNTGNQVRAYNVFREKYYEFVSTRKTTEPSALDKLNAMKQAKKEIVLK